MAIQFNTLQHVEKLKSAGIPDSQARAKTEALATALGESSSGTLVTKDDIAIIKIEMTNFMRDLYLMKWMAITLGAAIIFLVAKAFS